MVDEDTAADAETTIDGEMAADAGTTADETVTADEEPTADGGREPDEETVGSEESRDDEGTVRVWLVERTYSDDEQNMLILVYATPDGTRYHRKERALPSLHGGVPGTEASLTVPPDQLGDVTDPEEREYYASAAGRTAENNGPDDLL